MSREPSFAQILRRGLIGAGIAAELLLTSASPAIAAGRGPDPDSPAVCKAIAVLAKSDPDLALELIEKLREPGWAEVGVGDPDTTVTALRDDCEAERLTALHTLATPESSFPKNVADFWEAFVSTWITPFGAPFLAATAISVALLIGARFATLLPRIRNGQPGRSGLRQGWIGVGTVILVILGTFSAVACTILLQVEGWKEFVPQLLIFAMIITGVIAIAAAVRLSVYLAGRVRISIDVYDAKGAADAGTGARINNLLRQIGASPPDNLENPVGSELVALTEAKLPSSSGNKPWEYLQPIVSFVFLGTPWRFRVDVAGTEETPSATVTARRNGKEVKTIDIWLNPKPPWDIPGARRMEICAASVVVVTLADNYDSGFAGLTGVQEWTSLAALHMASVDVPTGDAHDALITVAIESDRHNVMAEFYRRMAGRHANDRPGLKELAEWGLTEAEAAEVDLVRVLTRRVAALSAINLDAVAPTPEVPAGISLAVQVANLGELITLLKDDNALDGGRVLEGARTDVSIALEMVLPPGTTIPARTISAPWFVEAGKSKSPGAAYNMACYYEKWSPGSVAALEKLKIAVTDPTLKVWARTDPTLANTRNANPTIIFDTAISDPWTIATFAALRKSASAAGIRLLSELRTFGATKEVAKQLGVSRLELVRIQLAAAFVVRASAAAAVGGLDPSLRLEILGELISRDVNTEAQIPVEWTVASVTGVPWAPDEIAKSLGERFASPPTAAQISAWLGAVRTPAGLAASAADLGEFTRP